MLSQTLQHKGASKGESIILSVLKVALADREERLGGQWEAGNLEVERHVALSL